MHSPINRSSARGTTGKLSEEERQVLRAAKTLYRKGEGQAARQLSLEAGIYEFFGRWRDDHDRRQQEKLQDRIKRERIAAESDLPTNQLVAMKIILPLRPKVTRDNCIQDRLNFD